MWCRAGGRFRDVRLLVCTAAGVLLVALLAWASGADGAAPGFTVDQVNRDGSAQATLFTVSPTSGQFPVIADPDHLVVVAPGAEGTGVELLSLPDGAAIVLGQFQSRYAVEAVAAGAGLVVAATCAETTPGHCSLAQTQLWLLQAGVAPKEIATVTGEAGVTWGSLALSPDGRTLAVSTFMPDCGSATGPADCGGYWLWLVEVATGSVRRVGYHGRWQSFAPDGRYLSYVGFLRGNAENNVMLYDIRRATVRRLGRANVAAWASRDKPAR